MTLTTSGPPANPGAATATALFVWFFKNRARNGIRRWSIATRAKSVFSFKELADLNLIPQGAGAQCALDLCPSRRMKRIVLWGFQLRC
jgi:hypothetical protein